MADQDLNTRGNGDGGDAALPQAATLAQYIKDLSVESPNAPRVFKWQAQPQLDVQFNIAVESLGDNMHEVVLKIEVGARSEQGVHFLIDLSYGGLFALRNVPEDAVGVFLLVEAPRLLFPFMRQIVADCSQQTGFPPLLLDPIDFGAAYMAQIQAQEEQQQSQGRQDGDAVVGDAIEGDAVEGGEGDAVDAAAEPSDETPKS